MCIVVHIEQPVKLENNPARVKMEAMRFLALAAGCVAVMGGGLYFMTTVKASGARYELIDALQPPPVVAPRDILADESDRETIRRYLAQSTISDYEHGVLVRAAGRRYMRRKLQLAEGERWAAAGKIKGEALEDLRKEVESARKVVDVSEGLGQKQQLAESAQAEFEMEVRLANVPGMKSFGEKYSGHSAFTERDLDVLAAEFERVYHHELPVSARGQGPVHRSMGFDHTGRFDLALNPNAAEGTWVRSYLVAKGVPFLTFQGAVRGQATGAHIHVGLPSTRVPKG